MNEGDVQLIEVALLGSLLPIREAALAGGGQDADPQQQQAQPGKQAWRQEADYSGPVRALEWGGIAYATATWQKRYAYLHRGRIYLLQKRSSPNELTSHGVWLNRCGSRARPTLTSFATGYCRLHISWFGSPHLFCRSWYSSHARA